MHQLTAKQLLQGFRVPPGKKVSLARDYDPAYIAPGATKESAHSLLRDGIQRLAKYQDMLYAQDTHALLLILQAMDAAGKDGVIKHVMSGINPQGCQVYSFKAPSGEELDHDYLWRCFKALPERGRIGIFNRSYYEEVLIARVHPEVLDSQRLPPDLKDKKIWKRRYQEINNFEEYLTCNGIHVLKVFLNISKEEQRRRFLARIEQPEKNWKFSAADVKERQYWDKYQHAFEEAFQHTSTKIAPWYVIPADNKWFTRLAVSRLIASKLKNMKLAYPTVDDEHRAQLQHSKELLEAEDTNRPTAKASEA